MPILKLGAIFTCVLLFLMTLESDSVTDLQKPLLIFSLLALAFYFVVSFFEGD